MEAVASMGAYCICTCCFVVSSRYRPCFELVNACLQAASRHTCLFGLCACWHSQARWLL